MYGVNRWILTVILGLSVLVQSGCARSKPARYYMLTAMSGSEQASKEGPSGGNVVIGIGPVTFPQYLDRPQIVTRSSENRVELAEFDRWAEPLAHNFSRVLAENLSTLLSTNYMVLYPWKGSTPIDYQVVLTAIRFDASLGGSAVLDVRWTVLDKDRKNVVPMRAAKVTEQAPSQTYQAIVQAESATLEELSRQIADAIRPLTPAPANP